MNKLRPRKRGFFLYGCFLVVTAKIGFDKVKLQFYLVSKQLLNQ
jgi:hypothetical protein